MADETILDESVTQTPDLKDYVHRSTLAKQGAEWKSKYDTLSQSVTEYDAKYKDLEQKYKDFELKYKDLEQNHRATVEDYTWTSALSSTPLKFDDEDVQSVTLQTLKQKFKKASPAGEVKLNDWLKEHLATEPSYLKPYLPAPVQVEEKREARKPSPKPPTNGGNNLEARKREIAAMPAGEAKTRAMSLLMAEMNRENRDMAMVAGLEMAIGDRFALLDIVPLAGRGLTIPTMEKKVNEYDGYTTLLPHRKVIAEDVWKGNEDFVNRVTLADSTSSASVEYVMSLASSSEEAFSSSLCKQFKNLNSLGDDISGSTLTVDTIYEAIADLEISGVMPGDQMVCVLHPKQLKDFRKDLRGEGGVMMWQNTSPEMAYKKGQAYAGRWNNVDFYSSTSVNTDGTSYYGAMFRVGCFKYVSPDKEKANPSYHPVNDITFLENKIALVMFCDIKIIQKSAGVSIKTAK